MSVSVETRPGDATVRIPHPAGARPAAATRLYGLDLLRVVAICGVVAIHVIGMVLGHDDLRGTVTWWGAAVLDIGFIWAVPVFVMISGALVLHPRGHAAGPGTFYRKRFLRILPALVVWHLVYLVGVRMLWRGEDLGFERIARLVLDAKVFTALYFLWLIAGLYLVAPVLAAFLRDGGPRRAGRTAAIALCWTLGVTVLVGAYQVLGSPRPQTYGAWTMWWPYVGYFVAGWALHAVVLSRRALAAVGLGTAALVLALVYQWGVRPRHGTLQVLLPVNYLGPTVALAAIGVFLLAVNLGNRWRPGPAAGRRLARLADATFGVFLVHLLVYEVIKAAVPAMAEARSLPVMLGAYGLVLAASFAISLGAARVPYLRTIF
ncbi:hypothetical protein GCM10010123_14370 [Pilimelia anulata]|uniref:Acyltransferase 3 domain-containing protein n=1 Tax=Pilimelia anulata TaxID=53371 RepID=A0A8J3B8N8_9ACTN|nr:acyltransferase family protein [Pilimelia anulata]GGJ85878.1 hypothetical protein GCM10010123_14370 [Pilimelia anulata]